MSVIVELEVAAESFELGRVLAVPGRSAIDLEDMVPLGEQVVPLFWLHETRPSEFVEVVESHEAVENVTALEETREQTLYALQWDASRDRLFETVSEQNGFLLSGAGREETWTLQIHFPDHENISQFSEQCAERDISFDVEALYKPTRPDLQSRCGLTEVQHETLLLAVDRGYYDIPREVSTQELADELDVSDQAVTERLRRAVRTLVNNTLRTSAGDSTPRIERE